MTRFAANWMFESPGGLPSLRVNAPTDASYAVKIVTWDTGVPVLSMFVRAGESGEASVPFGTYRIKMASGTTWYGDTVRFGPDTQYSQVTSPMEFSLRGEILSGHELTLSKVRDGNLRPSPIGADQF